MANDNLVVWTTDWHMGSYDGETTTTGFVTGPTKAAAVVSYINGTLDPVGCFDTGDNKDHYGATGTEDEHDNYITYVGNQLRWLTVNDPDENGDPVPALYPNLPGNHDEFYDYSDTPPGGLDYWPEYDAKFWSAPYHWTCDWEAPRIRFIGIHTYIHHIGCPTGTYQVDAPGMGHVVLSDMAWLENELHNLPDRYQAIVVSHFPIDTYFGNNVNYTGDDWNYATTPLADLIGDNNVRVACALSGHRHSNWSVAPINQGVVHITAGGVSYGAANGYGSFVTLTYDPDLRTITFDCLYARSPYERLTGFSPYTIQLQPHRLFFSRTP